MPIGTSADAWQGADIMNVLLFVTVVLFFALAITGRRLRERAFRLLSVEQKALVVDKVANYNSAELIPFAGLMLGFSATLLFRQEWLKVVLSAFLVGMVLLTAVFHVRARRRFSQLALPESFLSEYETSRIVTYSALAFPLGLGAWVLSYL